MSEGVAPRDTRARYTFRGNLRATRHGWLRLTPAYSVHVVRELLAERARPELPVLDPFCGTGTTALACAEAGIDCDTIDINPFLLWLTRTKVARYSRSAIGAARSLVAKMGQAVLTGTAAAWVPPIHHIDRWWDPDVAAALARAHAVLARRAPSGAADLARLAFCRTLLECGRVSFGHQSLSFAAAAASTPRPEPDGVAGAAARVADTLERALEALIPAAELVLGAGCRRALAGDARALERVVPRARYGTVITSPPYVNRMSYVRELRPYMYWLSYLRDPADAGALDWLAIGGTWGAATSNLARWRTRVAPPIPELSAACAQIAPRSDLLARYVERYFVDLWAHTRSLARRVAPGGRIAYVIGNSKFYDVLIPAEQYLATLLRAAGLSTPEIRTLRSRTSKAELFEYLVTAEQPGSTLRNVGRRAMLRV